MTLINDVLLKKTREVIKANPTERINRITKIPNDPMITLKSPLLQAYRYLVFGFSTFLSQLSRRSRSMLAFCIILRDPADSGTGRDLQAPTSDL